MFYVTLSYSFNVLKPIEKELLKRGHEVAWFLRPGTEAERYTAKCKQLLKNVEEVMNYKADAMLAPGNKIPEFFPGLKVQVFHGFDSGKKGKYRIRGFFDLYCTQGPKTTRGFLKAREKNKTFDVVETGWPKLDPLFTPHPEAGQYRSDKPVILYAPTFSPSLTSTYALRDEIERLSKTRDWQWLVKFHPKVTTEEVEMYEDIQSDKLRVVHTSDVIPLLQAADVLLSDTSSILSEFALLGKTVVTLNNRQPESWMINITQPDILEPALVESLSPSPKLKAQILSHAGEVHPYTDGLSSARTVDAIEAMIEKGTQHLAKKPPNLFRKLKERKKLRYWKV